MMKCLEYMRSGMVKVLCGVVCLACVLCPAHGRAAESGEKWPEAPEIAGEAAIVMETTTGTILFEKNMHDVHYPASITKIMTVLLAIENCEMDEIVTVPPEAVYMEDKGSHIALDAGEQLTVEQCLYAVMLASANDASYALAQHVGGTVENFADMMNKRAEELGCLNTHFTNPHGLPDEEHVTSAYDMALITQAAMEYETFRRVAGTSYYEIPPTDRQKDLICMYNHHKMIGKGEFADEEVFAGKNGYTDIAKNTLVTCAKRGDMEIVCVVLKEQGNHVYQDTAALLAYGLDSFVREEIKESAEYYGEMLRNKNPLLWYGDVFSWAGPAYAVIPAGLQISDLDVDFTYDEAAGHVTVQYQLGNRLAGTAMMTVNHLGKKAEDWAKKIRSLLPEEENQKGNKGIYFLLGGIGAGAAVGGILYKNRLYIVRWSRWKRADRKRRKEGKKSTVTIRTDSDSTGNKRDL